MGHVPVLDDLAIVAALAVAMTVILSKLQLPTVAELLAPTDRIGAPHRPRRAQSLRCDPGAPRLSGAGGERASQGAGPPGSGHGTVKGERMRLGDARPVRDTSVER